MDSDSWEARLSTSSRGYRSRSEMYSDDADTEEDSKVEYVCPFCGEDFDIVGLYCHMDEEHPVAMKSGVCPVCSKRVGLEFVAHITTQHGNILKIQHRKRLRKGGLFSSTLNALRREQREGNMQSGSLLAPSSASAESDTLLSSFVFSPLVDTPVNTQPHHPSHEAGEANGLDENHQDKIRVTQKSSIPSKDREEAAQKCEFVRGLLSSTILDDEDL